MKPELFTLLINVCVRWAVMTDLWIAKSLSLDIIIESARLHICTDAFIESRNCCLIHLKEFVTKRLSLLKLG